MKKTYYILIFVILLNINVKAIDIHYTVLKCGDAIENTKIDDIKFEVCDCGYSNWDLEKMCNSSILNKCSKFYDNNIFSTIPICKENKDIYSLYQLNLKIMKDLHYSLCTTDGDNNFCSFNTLFDYESHFDNCEFSLFNRTMINETCKSKKCTDGFIKSLDSFVRLTKSNLDYHEKYKEFYDDEFYYNSKEFYNKTKESFTKLKSLLTAEECVSQNKNDLNTNGTNKVICPFFKNIFGTLMLLMFWWMYNLF